MIDVAEEEWNPKPSRLAEFVLYAGLGMMMLIGSVFQVFEFFSGLRAGIFSDKKKRGK